MTEIGQEIDIEKLRSDIQTEVTRRALAVTVSIALAVTALAAIGAWTLLKPMLQDQLEVVTKSDLDTELSAYVKTGDISSIFNGVVVIVSENAECPTGSEPIANTLLQFRRDDPRINEIARLRAASSTFDAGNNWQGSSFSVCHFG